MTARQIIRRLPNQSNDSQSNPTTPNQSNPTPAKDNQSKPIIANTSLGKAYHHTSPNRDFQKVPNSITRNALPDKLFKGTSKNTYDTLYLKTRGAIKPSRTIEATKRELMRWTGISHVTIFKHIKHLELVGLIGVERKLGSQDGSIYEVFIPEELKDFNGEAEATDDNPTNDSPTDATQLRTSNGMLSDTIQSKNIVSDASNNIALDKMGNFTENKTAYGNSKTTLNTLNSDDEGFTQFIEVFQAAAVEITGKKLTKREEKHLANLAELLVLELRIAARRTKSISSVPSFLTEILRRKLRISPLPSKRIKTNPDTVGKPVEEKFEIKTLSPEEREENLIQLQDFAEDDFLGNFKQWYTEEDWNWLIENLKK